MSARIRASEEGGIVAKDTEVTLSTIIGEAEICYTIDGSEPTANSLLYISPIVITKNTVLKAVAVKDGQVVSNVMTVEYLVKAATPTANKEAKTYDSAQSVTLACSYPGTSIYYTTDGSRPTTSCTKYTEPISVSKNTTIMAIAASDDYHNSDIMIVRYGIRTATPTSSLANGKYGEEKAAALSCTSQNTMIYYTLDGTTPTTSSNLYSSELSLSSVLPVTKTLKFIAVAEGYEPSYVATYTYTLYTIGPGGGIVFYDCDADNDSTNNGAGPDNLKSSTCNWRYLEASPEDIKVGTKSTFVFGYYRPSSSGTNQYVNGSTYEAGTSAYNDGKSTGTAIGTGLANTIKLVTKMGLSAYSSSTDTEKTENYAARLCCEYTYGGCSDWFLPSVDELNAMMSSLLSNGLGGVNIYTSLWSSSEAATSVYAAWSNNNDGHGMRSSQIYVRAIRAFMSF